MSEAWRTMRFKICMIDDYWLISHIPFNDLFIILYDRAIIRQVHDGRKYIDCVSRCKNRQASAIHLSRPHWIWSWDHVCFMGVNRHRIFKRPMAAKRNVHMTYTMNWADLAANWSRRYWLTKNRAPLRRRRDLCRSIRLSIFFFQVASYERWIAGR